MRRRLRFPAGVVSLSVALTVAGGPRSASAQETGGYLDQMVVAASLELAPADAANSLVQEGRKSPALAGVLSFLLPGVGSYYAGNSAHGTRHLVIEGVALGVFIWGAVESVDDILTGETDFHPALWVGTGALVVNGIWSIVTAVNDANTYNRTISVGSLYFEPSVVALTKPNLGGFDTMQPQTPGVGLQLVRFAF